LNPDAVTEKKAECESASLFLIFPMLDLGINGSGSRGKTDEHFFSANSYFCIMDIQMEKIELIKLLADVKNEVTIKKIKAILAPKTKKDETERLMANPQLVKKLRDARKEIKAGKGVKMDVKDLWK
jgi:hypothetical protein